MSYLGEQVNKQLKKIQKGDNSALDKLHDLTYNHLCGFAYRRLTNKSEVDEAVRVTYERAWQYIHSFNEEKDGYNWLCTILENVCNALNKKYINTQSLTDLEFSLADPNSSCETDQWLEKTEVRDAINQLEDVIDRNIVYYLFWEDYSLGDISKELHIPKTTVYDRGKRAREFLCKKIKKKLKKIFKNSRTKGEKGRYNKYQNFKRRILPMKKNVLVASALAAVLGFASLTPLAVRPASADTASDEKRYYDYVGPSLCEVTSEEITYTNKTESYTTTPYNVPYYTVSGSEMKNACGAVAGSIVVGFYDRYYENLIPNFTSYYTVNNRYKSNDGVYVHNTMLELYTLMRTNVDDVGVSEYDCRDGLQTYVENKGYSLSYSSVKSGSSFSYSLYRQAINVNKPVLLFCTELPIQYVSTGDSYDVVAKDTIKGCHIVVGFGYYTVNYYNGNTLFRTDNYLLIATGLHSNLAYYVNINSTSWFDNGYAVTIS